MIGVIATLNVLPGKEEEFEAAFGALAARVRADEPGNSVYQLTKSRTEAGVYKVLEIYADDDAIKAHRESAHFRELGARLGPCMAGRAVVEVLDAVG